MFCLVYKWNMEQGKKTFILEDNIKNVNIFKKPKSKSHITFIIINTVLNTHKLQPLQISNFRKLQHLYNATYLKLTTCKIQMLFVFH
jgi:hypothetical protein